MGGRLDKRIQFLVKAQMDDGFRREDEFQPDGNPVWGARVDVSDGEKFRAGQDAAWLMTRIRVHKSAFTSSITPSHRLTCDGSEFEILGMKEVAGRRRLLEITAVMKVQS